MAIEFDIDGKQYRANRLDAFKQFHVSRKIAPIVPKLIPIFVQLKDGGGLTEDLAGLAEVVAPFADALAAMKDDDAEYIIATCLSVVLRQQGTTWAPVWSVNGRVVMFEDIDMGVMLPIIVRVIRDNLGNFISGLLSNPAAAGPVAVTG